MIRWSWKCAFLSLMVLFVEVAIEHFFKTGFIRFFIGDFFILWLLYFAMRTILDSTKKGILIGVLSFAFFIEFLQLVELPERMGWEGRFSNLILGSSFDPLDLLAYILGGLSVYCFDLWIIDKHLFSYKES